MNQLWTRCLLHLAALGRVCAKYFQNGSPDGSILIARRSLFFVAKKGSGSDKGQNGGSTWLYTP